ncbi:MAG: DUF819 family protein [Hungatella hathewayi]|nr:DUF819 family protein [Hungatella hathewayi]
MEALFTSTQSLLMIIFLVMAAAFLLQKVKGIKTMGPVLIVLLLGVILTNLKVVPISHELYGVVSNYFVPMSISLYLLSFDAKKLKILLTRDSLLAFASMLVSVCLVAVVGGLFFAHQIDEGWKIAGMFVGTYTGGSSQLTAIGTGLEVTGDTLALANASDYVIGMPSLIFFFAAPALMKASKWFNRVWPYQVPEKELTGEGEHVDLGKKPFTLQEVVFLLATAFTVVAVSTLLAETLLPASLQKSMRVIIITTLSLLAAQIPAVQKLNGNFDLGLLFSMVFITTIGFQVNIALFAGSALMITLFCFCVIVGSFLLHCVITRLLKVKYEFSLLAIVAGIADGTTASIVASGADWKSLVQVGMIMGVAAGAMGNYVGIGVAYLVKMLAGV